MSAPSALAARLLEAWDSGRQITPPSETEPGFDLARGYAVAAEIAEARTARGERIIGRKIGFTNRNLWPLYGVDGPIWGWMYAHTVADIPADGRIPLPTQPEPRIEPDIAFGFRTPPVPGMSAGEIAACIDWVAHGVEIVVSLYPGWKLAAADAVAGMGMHGALWLGPRRPLGELLAAGPAALERFSLTLEGPGESFAGQGSDVLGGPLHAIAFLLDEIARMPGAPTIQPGEIITTGTLTDARPIASGQSWRTRLTGLDLPGLSLSLS